MAISLGLSCIIGLFGFLAVQPNDSRVLLLFGKYIGTVKQSGFFWVNPFYSKKHISLRVRNFETGSSSIGEKKDERGQVVQQKSRTHGRPSKVNDKDDERKAAMVSNLLVVLCSDRHAQPVVNTGTLHN